VSHEVLVGLLVGPTKMESSIAGTGLETVHRSMERRLETVYRCTAGMEALLMERWLETVY
jgi:hypothetical protein